MTRRVALALAMSMIASVAARPAAAGIVVCKRRQAVTVRVDTCRKKETRVASLGAQWALVDAGGAIVAQSGGISVAIAQGVFYVIDFGVDQTGRAVHATPTLTTADAGFRGVAVAGLCGGTQAAITGLCPAGMDTSHHVYVATTSVTNGVQEAHAFYVSTN